MKAHILVCFLASALAARADTIRRSLEQQPARTIVEAGQRTRPSPAWADQATFLDTQRKPALGSGTVWQAGL